MWLQKLSRNQALFVSSIHTQTDETRVLAFIMWKLAEAQTYLWWRRYLARADDHTACLAEHARVSSGSYSCFLVEVLLRTVENFPGRVRRFPQKYSRMLHAALSLVDVHAR